MAKIPRAGELRHTIDIIHREVIGSDGHGQPIHLDQIVSSDWLAALQQLSGRDLEYARQLYHEAQYRLRCRATPLIYPGAFIRVASTGLLFAVGYVIELEEREIWQEVLLQKVDPNEVSIELNVLLLENGKHMLTESGAKLLLE